MLVAARLASGVEVPAVQVRPLFCGMGCRPPC